MNHSIKRNMNRRSFLRLTGTAFSALAVSAALPASALSLFGLGGGESAPAAEFNPVPLGELVNLKDVRKKATDEQLQEAYNVAVELMRPLAGKPVKQQVTELYSILRHFFDTQMTYSMTSEHYNDPYGFFVLKSASCAGCARATGFCLNILGLPFEHVHPNKYCHQWARVLIDGEYWICDPYCLYVGPEPAPYKHPNVTCPET